MFIHLLYAFITNFTQVCCIQKEKMQTVKLHILSAVGKVAVSGGLGSKYGKVETRKCIKIKVLTVSFTKDIATNLTSTNWKYLYKSTKNIWNRARKWKVFLHMWYFDAHRSWSPILNWYIRCYSPAICQRRAYINRPHMVYQWSLSMYALFDLF